MINRRTLLTGLALAPFAGLLAAEDKERLRVAQIGTSHAHAAGKMDALRSLPDLYDVVGYAEPIASRQAAAQKAKSFAGLKYLTEAEILADPSIRVVVIETTLEDSARAAFAALKAGKHIHLDKPGAEKHANFVALRRYAAEKGLTVQMGYMLRYNPAIQLLVRAVKEGWLGDVMEIDASMGKLLDEAGRKRFAQIPGGGMVDGMGAPPDVIGCEGQHAQSAPDPVAQMAVAEERPVAAIVLDDEQAHQKAAVQQRQGQADPDTDGQRPPGQRPDGQKGNQAQPQFKGAAAVVGLAVAGKNLDPILRLFRGGVRRVRRSHSGDRSFRFRASESGHGRGMPRAVCRARGTYIGVCGQKEEGR
jgi:hypothetical protein